MMMDNADGQWPSRPERPTDDESVARRRRRPTLQAGEDIEDTLKELSANMAACAVPRGIVHLGGGSVLAAAWAHRRSTDIDLWMPHEEAEQVTRCARNEGEWRLVVCPDKGTIDKERTRWAEGSAALTLNAVPVSLFTTHFAQARLKFRQMMRGTIFGAATTEEILTGKIIGRWTESGKNLIPIRDVYDIYVARALEPVALDKVLRKMREREREQAAARLRALPQDWHEADPKRIIEPAFDLELRGAGTRLADAIESGDCRHIENTRRNGKKTRTRRTEGFER